MHLRHSHRLPASFAPNPLTLALSKVRAEGKEILDLTLSNPTDCGLDYPSEPLRGALGAPEVLGYRPDNRGSAKAREAVAAWHGHSVAPEDVLLTASTSEAYTWLFKLLCDPGDEVLVPSPSYPLFEWLARLEGIAANATPSYWHERWHLDLVALEEACTPRTRALILVNPNNPTGHFLSRSEWEQVLEFCAQWKLALIVDEVFADYGLEAPEEHLPTALETLEPPCPLFVLSGLSKVAGLPQVKLGWIVARGAHAKALLEPLGFIADQFLSVSASAQSAALAALEAAPAIQAQIRRRLKSNLEELDRQLLSYPAISRLPVEGGWSVLLRRPALDSAESCALRLLEEAQVLVHPGHFFDLPGENYLVLSLLPPLGVFARGMAQALPILSLRS
ncbi:pyridoxal phosphate-dependent aminotransferase [Holophaga foetida]|uniref:pyridoxal phosphate-dependent aminotransferase n=1 Tax=Holophaga foetida TaxID=35839 RepID=UPI0002E41D92|nr:pyridoxal phosphate-dependent aminotransferase [Holophaga foetida]